MSGGEWTTEELEDLIADAITDSLDMDWTSRDGARFVLRELADHGLHIVPSVAQSTPAPMPVVEDENDDRPAWELKTGLREEDLQ